MATTRLMPLHIGKGRTVSTAIADIIDYAENPEKTGHGKYIYGHECDTRTADAEFALSKRQYFNLTGRKRGADDVIAYHLRQSFKPGEITPEDANRIGRELAMTLTKGNHAFIVCTHIDKQHINERNGNTGFSGTRSHNEQTSAVLLIEPFAQVCDSHFLIRTVSDAVTNLEIRDIPTVSTLHHQFKLVNGVECHHGSIGIDAVNDLGHIAVGIVEDRLVAVGCLHALAVQIHLMATFFGRYACFLGLYDGKGFAISTVQNIVAKPNALGVRHTQPHHYQFHRLRLHPKVQKLLGIYLGDPANE